MATALAMTGALVLSMGVVLMGASAASANGDTNQASTWQTQPGEICTKVDDDGASTGGYTVTQDPRAGYTFSKIILKKGNDDAQGEENTVIGDNEPAPVKGGTYFHASGSGYSHVILCQVPRLLEVPTAPVPTAPDCDTDGSLVLPSNDNGLTWSIVKDGGAAAGSSPYGPGVYDVTVTSAAVPFVGGGMTRTFENITVLAATGDCPTRVVPGVPVPTAPDCDTDGSLALPSNGGGLTWSIVQVSGADDNASPYGPGVYQVSVTSSGLPFPGGDHLYTYPDITVRAATGNCTSTTTTTVSEERSSCELGLERRTGTVTTVNGQAQSPVWGSWSFVRGLSNAEFEQLGCRPDQPEPIELLGAETRMDCTGVQQRESTQVTTFEWNETAREYDQVVGAVEWSDWVKIRNLTNKELRAEGCVLGEETLVPKPKPEQKPTVKGVERVAPSAAVPTAVAAGVGGGETGSSLTYLVAQMLLVSGMLLLLAGVWVGLGRREAGAHEA